MDWQAATKNDQGLIKIPKRWLHVHYYEATNILFRFENSLRIFVYVVLKNAYSDKWRECSFPTTGGESASIKGIATRRISQAENFGHLGFDIKAPLMHLTSGELVELITADAYWPVFKIHFRGNKEIIKNKLLEIGTIRNSLAHFRPMKAEDIELVKQNSRHTLLGVEECLVNIFTQSLRVPTNTIDQWYSSISTLGTDQITTTPFYSRDESWINIRLKIVTPILSKERYSDKFYSFKVAKVNTPNILLNHESIRKYVTYLSEWVGSPVVSQERDIVITKDLNFVFKKNVLADNHDVLAQEFGGILRKVAEECELLLQDNLARGTLVEPAGVTSWWQQPDGKDGRWIHNYAEFWQPYQSNHPDEYWGQHQFTGDIVAGCRRYPWMPEDISDLEDDFWE